MLDEHIEHFTTLALRSKERLSADRIEVESRNGTITLSGDVQSFCRKLDAAKIAAMCDGVKKVKNNLKVISKENVPDLKISKQINEALAGENSVNEHVIRIDINSGRVTLSGYTSTSQSKILAGDIVLGVKGVRSVNNLIVVNDERVQENSELGTSIEAEICRVLSVKKEQIFVSVVDEMAKLSGSVDAAWKGKVAEEVVRKFGIVKLYNEICSIK